MANIGTETPGLSDSTSREDSGGVESEEVRLDVTSTTVPHKVPETIDAVENVTEGTEILSVQSDSPRPTIITAVASGSTSSTGLSAPHPKKFSAVNINKKFLQKNSSPISSSPTSANTSSLKSGAPAHPVARPTVHPSASHSRLVTAKLTATLQPSTTTGPGWSRPSSVNPSVSPSPPVPNPSGQSVTSLAPVAPQLPHAGKVIQPQHRATAISAGGNLKKDGSGKPVWGNVGRGTSPADARVQDDFPTAAEVASVTTSVRKAKLLDAKEAAENAAADKQARSVEADTFRGVHLDPNAHHWDEMEEDDDNFLDGVIEFGDGRQYKVEPADAPASSTDQPGSNQDVRFSPQVGEAPLVPVSKEERFADDYDRSWPRSKTSPAIAHREPPPHAQHPMPPSPSSSQATHSPQDASRVLFNERSNKLEPYGSTHPSHRPGPSPISHPLHRKGSLAEPGTQPSDARGGRDIPPHAQAANVQLLQKSGAPVGDALTRAGPFGPIPAGSTTFSKDRLRDRDPRRLVIIPPGQDSSRSKDHFGPPSTSSTSKDQGREVMSEPRGRRLSNMGPPSIPASMRDRSKETGRQLPPHLAQMPAPPPPLRRLSSKEPQPRPSSTVPSDSPSSRRPSFAHPHSQSPVLSHVSVTSETPSQALSIPPVDLDQVHKAAMHLSAERAKQRRQQEEEDRAKQMERARQKAAELAETLKASASAQAPVKPVEESKPSDMEVTKFLEDTVQSASSLSARPLSSPMKHPLQRPPSLRGLTRQPNETSRSVQPLRSPQSATAGLSPAVEAESWRSKAKSHPTPAPRQIHARPSAPPTTPKPLPPMLHGVETFAVQPDEDLEVVDFSDMGKFVGIADAPPPPQEEQEGPTMDDRNPRPSRPVAADFFDDNSSTRDPATSKGDTGPWRRKFSHDSDRDLLTASPVPKNQPEIVAPPLSVNAEQRADTTSDRPQVASEVASDAQKEKTASHEPQSLTGSSRTISALPVISGQRASRSTPAFREAAMSTLNDAMSRIKGALDGMQQKAEISKDPGHSVSGEVQSTAARAKVQPMPATPKALPRESKWVPPALRPRNTGFDQQAREVFDITIPEPPRSPRPAWNTYVVRLPRISRPLEPLNKRQSHLQKISPGQVRWDILSFHPPVEGMLRRDFSLNAVLFGKPQHIKGKHRYIVSLPNAKPLLRERPGSDGITGPKIRMPPGPLPPKVNGVGAFGRPSGATDVSTWRKSAAPSLMKAGTGNGDSGLNTVSRSPPPDLVSNAGNVASTQDESVSCRPKSQPKMPAGSAVAFYRDSRVDSLESAPKSAVNFTVTSELEDSLQSKARNGPQQAGSPSVKVAVALPNAGAHATSVVSELKSQPGSPEFVPTLLQSSKSSEDLTDRPPITPPSQSANAAWTKSPMGFPVKDSPARAPDPEHLKAVWSQASDKARVHAVNSLEGIADDLTGLPFTLQDVKSEDGETPPPTTAAAPSRMSLHDVTRAFQQVPSSSSTTAPQRSAPLSPPSVSGPVARPPSFQYSLPPTNPNMQPPYVAYPSPMMSHSPSPTLVYPTSPGPGRMPVNGHSPMFSQPLWMPLSAPAQVHSMMRPVPSPYPGQIMQYPSSNGGPSMYAHHPQPNMQNPTSHQQPGAPQVRGRGIPPMSPALQHTTVSHPMYPNSPVLMQAATYMTPASTGRGQLRNDTPGHSPMQHVPSGHHPSPHLGYSPVPPTSFTRSNW